MIGYDGSQFRVLDGHELVGFTMAQGEDRQYLAVVHTDREDLPYGDPLPALPDDPLRARHEALQGFLGPAARRGRTFREVLGGVVGNGPRSL